ncbi:MAG: TlpA family protein disulfide reductase [Thiotrichales bacterium]
MQANSKAQAAHPRRTRPSLALPALAAVTLIAAPLAFADTTAPPALTTALTATQGDKPAPALILKDMDDQEHSLERLKGRVVLVNFWATWCPPCRREMPSLERLHQKLKDQPFSVLAVDVGESVETIFSFIGQLDPAPTFPILLDTDSKGMQAWPVRGLPTTYIIDKQGRLAYTAIGGREFDDEGVVRTIERLLAAP